MTRFVVWFQFLISTLADTCVEQTHGQKLLQTAFTQEKAKLEDPKRLERALIQRIQRTRGHAYGRSLDTTVATKGFDWIDDAIDGMVDAANTVADYGSQIGTELSDVGLSVGSVAGNSALLVGKSLVQTAEQSYQAVPSHIKAAASSLGNTVLSTSSLALSVGEQAAKAAAKLSQDGLQKAQHTLEQGTKVTSKIGQEIASRTADLGDFAVKLGPLATGLAVATWEAIKDMIGCFFNYYSSMCTLFLDDVCDCAAGSSLSLSTSGISINCVFKAGSFTQGFGLSAGGRFEKSDGTSSRVKLPGIMFSQERKSLFADLKEKKILRPRLAPAPAGACSGHMNLSLDGLVQFDPSVAINLDAGGKTVVGVSGMVRVSAEALLEAEGSCALEAGRRFPKRPLTKVFCAGHVCVAIILQMLAEMEIAGTMTGSTELSASADFEISSKITLDVGGNAHVDIQSPQVKHQSGFTLAASASAVVRLSLGPELTVWPMPGAPVTFNPMMNAEVRGQATVEFMGQTSALQVFQNATEQAEQTPSRHCTVFEKWRMKWLGVHVEIPLGSTPYGANVGSWENCLSLCQSTEGCQQVVFHNGHCYGMNEASSEDQDSLGGENEHYISAHCTGVNTINMCAAAALNLFTDVEIQGFALPKGLELLRQQLASWAQRYSQLSCVFLQLETFRCHTFNKRPGERLEDAITSAILEGAKAMVNMMLGPVTGLMSCSDML